MKNIKYLFSLLCLALVAFACNDNYDRTAGGPFKEGAPVLSIGQGSIQLQPANENGTDTFLMRINWSQPRFTYESGLPVEVTNLTYTIQMDLADNSFAHPVTIATTGNLFTDIFSNQLSQWVTGLLGVEALENNQLVQIRVQVTYQQNGVEQEPIYSNVANLEVQPIPKEPEPESVTIRWKQTEGNWSAFAVYAWGAKEVFGGWPGKVVEPDANGWYSVDVPGYTPLNLILNNNNGGAQFDFLSATEDNPLKSGDYYVNTTKGTFEKAAVTIRWKQVEGDWNAFAVYAWGDSEIFGGWPGKVVEPDGDGWYSIDVPSAGTFNLILNNNNGGKQFDFVNSTTANPMQAGLYAVNTVNNTFKKIEELTIRWKQTVGDWDAFAVYSWGGSPNVEAFGGWPGTVVKADDNGWYSIAVPAVRPMHMILNNNGGGKQFDFLVDPFESASYEINTTTGSWTEDEGITIRWKYIGSDWTSFAIYAWGGTPTGETFGSWPGTKVTPDANGWCSVTVPSGQTVGNVIFNNTSGGAGNQFNVNMDITSSVCFEITSSSFTVVDCQ